MEWMNVYWCGATLVTGGVAFVVGSIYRATDTIIIRDYANQLAAELKEMTEMFHDMANANVVLSRQNDMQETQIVSLNDSLMSLYKSNPEWYTYQPDRFDDGVPLRAYLPAPVGDGNKHVPDDADTPTVTGKYEDGYAENDE